MLDRDPRRLAAWAAAAVLIVLLSALYLARSRFASDPTPPPVAASIDVKSDGADDARVTVDVAGAVKHPGVYRLTSSQRIEDALKRAGGPTRRADLSQINRAAKLEDGRQVLVPVKASRSTSSAPSPTTPSQPLNLNTATLEQLDTLDGVGPTTAQKIIDFRIEHGGFGSVDELDQIPGIGEKRLAAFRESVRV
ncbi:helix-hairpin-helix domain-containing protein [Solirubrobacter ginsenosidimutans]|uniref:Helix-hairpin-helix domain-containing protein n=1 Tax=Solirubrobacter ginsenosidimutans TaxID=490573 RepID=A0A9X3MY32_9ACTN|nr:helix-hairpin-helix domain-containing protein [Solirubrobacter ginsenosidimutans]MDA0163488.1 helix-hairpin-helix domain-containing protein [Solirubrobacter ginsenosidimutans]